MLEVVGFIGAYFFNIQEYVIVDDIIMSDQRIPLLRSELEYKRARRSVVLSNYDPFQYPADIEAAKRHGLARRVCKAVPRSDTSEVCPCCLLPVENTEIPLGCSLRELVHLGVCYPLYFETIKLCIILLTLHLVFAGLPAFFLNILGTNCAAVNNNTWICKLSIMNILDMEELKILKIQNILNLTFVFICFIVIEAMKFRLHITRLKYIEFEDEPADYSILLKGLPKDITLYQIQQFMQEQLINLDTDSTVVKIYLIYDGKQYLQLYDRQRAVYDHKCQLEEKHRKMMLNAGSVKLDKRVAYMKKCENILEEIGEDENTVEQIEAEVSQYEMAMRLMVEDLLHGHTGADVIAPQKQIRFSGKCIVTLNCRESAEKLANHYQLTTHQKCIYKLQQCLKLDSQYKKFYKGNIIKVSMAPEPSDIIYANMGSQGYQKLRSRVFGAFIVSSVVGLVFVILTFSKKLFNEFKTVSSAPMVFSFSMSIIVGMFNSVLGRIIRYFAEDEFYTRMSIYLYNVTKRLLRTVMMNMILTTLISNLVSFYLFNEHSQTYKNVPLNFTGLVNDFFFLSATNPLLACIFTFFDYRYAYRLYKRWQITHGTSVTQAQANMYFQNQPMDMAQRYSHLFRCVLFTACVCTVIPNAILISLLVLFMIYWNDKYLMLRRYTCQYKLGYDLPRKMMQVLGAYPVLFVVSNTLLMYVPVKADKNGVVFTTQSSGFFYASLGIMIAVVLMTFSPTNIIYKCFTVIFKNSLTNNSRDVSRTYKDRELEFLEDYSHHYPCFRVSKAQRKASDFSQDQPLSPRKALLQQTNKKDSKSALQMIKDYIINRRYNIRQ